MEEYPLSKLLLDERNWSASTALVARHPEDAKSWWTRWKRRTVFCTVEWQEPCPIACCFFFSPGLVSAGGGELGNKSTLLFSR